MLENTQYGFKDMRKKDLIEPILWKTWVDKLLEWLDK